MSPTYTMAPSFKRATHRRSIPTPHRTPKPLLEASATNARITSVLPHPGGPCSSAPRGGFMLSAANMCGYCRGQNTICCSYYKGSSRPPISAKLTSSATCVVLTGALLWLRSAGSGQEMR